MSTITASLDSRRLLADLARLPDRGRAVLAPWLKKQAALAVSSSGKYKGMVQATPPFQLNAKASPVSARKAGEAKVKGGIWAVYGLPRDLYARIRARAGPDLAKAFWAAYKANDITAANDIARREAGASFGAFDDGAEHKRRRKDGNVTGRYPTSFTTKRAWIEAYIKEKQRLVGLLASALVGPGKAQFGALNGVPAFVARNDLPGSSISHDSSSDGESYNMQIRTMYNKDLGRIADLVVAFRIKAMTRELPHVIKSARLLPP